MAGHADEEPAVHGAGHGSRRDYLLGFAASVVLTAMPFWLVMSGVLGNAAATVLIVVALAVVQIIVHVRFFLHIDARGEGGWTLVSFLFTAIIVVITIGGSIWAMYQMNANMMPMGGGGSMQMP